MPLDPKHNEKKRRENDHLPIFSPMDFPVEKQKHEQRDPQKRNNAAQIPEFGASPAQPDMKDQDHDRNKECNGCIHDVFSFSCLYFSMMIFAVSRSIRESTASPLIKAENGSSSFWSLNSIF